MSKLKAKEKAPSVRRSTVAAYKRACIRQLYKALRNPEMRSRRHAMLAVLRKWRKMPVRKYEPFFVQMQESDSY